MFQFSKVKLNPASVVTPCPTTRSLRSRQLWSQASTRRWMSGRWSKACTTFMINGRPLISATPARSRISGFTGAKPNPQCR